MVAPLSKMLFWQDTVYFFLFWYGDTRELCVKMFPSCENNLTMQLHFVTKELGELTVYWELYTLYKSFMELLWQLRILCISIQVCKFVYYRQKNKYTLVLYNTFNEITLTL